MHCVKSGCRLEAMPGSNYCERHQHLPPIETRRYHETPTAPMPDMESNDEEND